MINSEVLEVIDSRALVRIYQKRIAELFIKHFRTLISVVKISA